MVNVLFLAPYRIAPLSAIKYLAGLELEKKIEIKVICTDVQGINKFKKFVSNDCVFIKNNVRNERSLIKNIREKKINILISIQHPWIIPEKIIKLLDGNAFNNHMAKLPSYRGHHTSVHAILNGEKRFATTLHTMERQVDLGLEVASRNFSISKLDTSQSLQKKMAISCLSNIRVLMHSLINNKKLVLKKIKGEKRFYSKNSIFSLKQILDSDTETQIDRKIRAFYHPPHEPAFKLIENKKVYIVPAWTRSGPNQQFR